MTFSLNPFSTVAILILTILKGYTWRCWISMVSSCCWLYHWCCAVNIFYKIVNHIAKNIKQILSVTLLCTVDSNSSSAFLLAMESVVSGLLEFKRIMDVYSFFIAKKNINFGFLLPMLTVCFIWCYNRNT